MGKGYELGKWGLYLRDSRQLLDTYSKSRSKVKKGWTHGWLAYCGYCRHLWGSEERFIIHFAQRKSVQSCTLERTIWHQGVRRSGWKDQLEAIAAVITTLDTRNILVIYVKLWDKWGKCSISIFQISSLQKNGLQAWYSNSSLIPSRNLSKSDLFIPHYFLTWEENVASVHI